MTSPATYERVEGDFGGAKVRANRDSTWLETHPTAKWRPLAEVVALGVLSLRGMPIAIRLRSDLEGMGKQSKRSHQQQVHQVAREQFG